MHGWGLRVVGLQVWCSEFSILEAYLMALGLDGVEHSELSFGGVGSQT